MKELLSAMRPDIDLAEYRRDIRPRLDATRLTMEALVGSERFGLKAPYEGQATLLIRYQGYEGALSGISEEVNGEVWKLLQFQGAKSQKSYRVDSGLNWRSAFAAQIRKYAEHPESDVKQLWIPATHSVTNLVDAVNLEGARAGYGLVSRALGLQWSDERKGFVADVTKNTHAKLLRLIQ